MRQHTRAWVTAAMCVDVFVRRQLGGGDSERDVAEPAQLIALLGA
jgi:hypothetical protein